MGGGGTLTVKLKNLTEGFAEVIFEDTGEGITAQVLQKIFLPLFTCELAGGSCITILPLVSLSS